MIVNNLVNDIIRKYVEGKNVPWWSSGETWESIRFPDGYEKPPKEEFEASLQKLIEEHKWKELRQERTKRLADVDWIFSTDYHIPSELRKKWTEYRQKLRDLPSVTTDPEHPVWPEKPTVNPSGGSTVNVDLDHIANLTSQISLLQNVIFTLTKRIEALEQA